MRHELEEMRASIDAASLVLLDAYLVLTSKDDVEMERYVFPALQAIRSVESQRRRMVTILCANDAEAEAKRQAKNERDRERRQAQRLKCIAEEPPRTWTPVVVEDAPEQSSAWSELTEGGVRSFLEDGNKISAIKFYRERMGVSLKEAKDAVEAIQDAAQAAE